jgi:hypothetical protein
MAKIWEQENKRPKQDGQNLGTRKQQIYTGWLPDFGHPV